MSTIFIQLADFLQMPPKMFVAMIPIMILMLCDRMNKLKRHVKFTFEWEFENPGILLLSSQHLHHNEILKSFRISNEWRFPRSQFLGREARTKSFFLFGRHSEHGFTLFEQLFKVEPLSFMLKCLLARWRTRTMVGVKEVMC